MSPDQETRTRRVLIEISIGDLLHQRANIKALKQDVAPRQQETLLFFFSNASEFIVSVIDK